MTTTDGITTITRYRTSDGQEWDIPEDAAEHERLLVAARKLAHEIYTAGVCDARLSDEIAYWLAKHYDMTKKEPTP